MSGLREKIIKMMKRVMRIKCCVPGIILVLVVSGRCFGEAWRLILVKFI